MYKLLVGQFESVDKTAYWGINRVFDIKTHILYVCFNGCV